MRVIPGHIITTFQTKSGKQAKIRYPTGEDVQQFTDYINTLSKEDTFITFSGEQETQESEKKYMDSVFADMEKGDKLVIACFIDDRLVGVCDVYRDLRGKKRTRHIAIFGISIAKDFRGEGIGYRMATSLLAEAKKMNGIKQVILHVYGPNEAAQKLYTKLGFKEAGRIPRNIYFHGEYVDGVTMYLDL